ncbi:MAG TPA: hypothetical protein VHR45_20095 [Thermoanaerobaculia bacterium]|nr:hypothetical protein [Thermoanaerobaculia bacterium]
MPLTAEDRRAGYDWKLSIWQMEVSLTQVFARPVQGREFFEEVIRDNLDLGRPDRVQLIFEKRIPTAAPGSFRTRVIQQGVSPSLHMNGARTLLANMASKVAMSKSAVGPHAENPALLTRMSISPASSARRLTLAGSLRSAATNWARPPPARIASTV